MAASQTERWQSEGPVWSLILDRLALVAVEKAESLQGSVKRNVGDGPAVQLEWNGRGGIHRALILELWPPDGAPVPAASDSAGEALGNLLPRSGTPHEDIIRLGHLGVVSKELRAEYVLRISGAAWMDLPEARTRYWRSEPLAAFRILISSSKGTPEPRRQKGARTGQANVALVFKLTGAGDRVNPRGDSLAAILDGCSDLVSLWQREDLKGSMPLPPIPPGMSQELAARLYPPTT